MMSLNTGYEKTKISKDFTEKEIKMLLYFLEKNKDDEAAFSFAMRWFNCSFHTISKLVLENTLYRE